MKCKTCGKEIEETEFTGFFAESALETCDDCNRKEAAENKRKAEAEMAEHPEWYGPNVDQR
jgi:ribosome-binding protein aMBF1 (putative translation factor)